MLWQILSPLIHILQDRATIITLVSSLHLLILLRLTTKIKEIIEKGETIVAEVADRKLCLDANFASNKDTWYSIVMNDLIKTSSNRTKETLFLDNNQEIHNRVLISQTQALL